MWLLNRLLSLLKPNEGIEAINISLEATSVEQLIEQGNRFEDAGNLVGALRCYDEAVQAAPKFARAYLNRGNVLQIQNRISDAITAYRTAVSLQPNYAGAHLNLGNAYLRLRRHAEAADAYEKAITLNPQQPDALFGQAMAFESLRRLDDALNAVRKSIAIQANQAPAHALEGNLLAAFGRYQDAIVAFDSALAIDPSDFLAWVSRGDAQLQLACAEEALHSYCRAAQIQSGVALLHMKIANTYQLLGQRQRALEEMKRAMELDSSSSVILFNAANLFDEQGDYAAAIDLYKRALSIEPDAQTYNNLGNVQKRCGFLEEAFASFQQALSIDSRCLEAHCNLGLLFQQMGALEKALASMETAREINPSSALVQCNLTTVLLDLHRFSDALESAKRALELDPDMVEAVSNLGNVHLELGRLQDAATSFERALALSPDFAKARHNLSYAQLAMGQFAQGWPNYEYRVDEHRNSREPSPLPQWKGQPTSAQDRLLLFVEQGLGDMLQFARYLPLVAERFPAGVTLYAIRPLVSLFRRSFPMITVVDAVPADQSAWQWQCPLLSLPLAFGTVLETIPNRVPYLVPDPERVTQWKERIDRLQLPLQGHKKIGLVWKPGTAMNIARLKATSLQTLAPLLKQPSFTWFSLQKEPDPELVQWVNNNRIVDWSSGFHDFDDTAALAVNMDLVISVDTSVAHLAGGLGLPTWLLNRYASDWRWMREREDSPWYSTVRIFAQTQPGDWDGVVQRMFPALIEWHSSQVASEPSQAADASEWRRRGNTALQEGKWSEAAICYRRGIEACATDAPCHSNLGFALLQMGQRDEARQMLSAALALSPKDFDAMYMLGTLAQDASDMTQALAYFRAALAANPDFEQCRRSLCMALVQGGQPEQARVVMNERPAVDNNSFDYFLFKGNMHLACAEYVEAEAALLTACSMDPTNTTALNNLGAAQLGKRDAISAIATYGKVLAISPKLASTFCNRAAAFQLSGQIGRAIRGYRETLALDPSNLRARQNLLGALTHSMDCSPADYLAEARKFGDVARERAQPYTHWPWQPNQVRPLRVGFVSGDLRMHPVGYFLSGILAHVDCNVMQCIAYSNAVNEDSYSAQLRSSFAEWHVTHQLTDAELAAHIHADQIDILVDLAGHTAHNRLGVFAWRAAPIQVTWLGYWASTGVAEIDYILVDEVSVPPREASHFSEKPWYLPHTRLCFTPPTGIEDLRPSTPPALSRGFVTFGSFQKLDKLSDETLQAWAAVLNRLPLARLRLQSRPLGYTESIKYLQARLANANINLTRVDLVGEMPRDQYLQAYSDVDIVLDTFPFPGGTTTAEALWMGVPTLTLAGTTLLGRQGESMLGCLGMTDWVAYSTTEYVESALKKASDLEGLAALRATLREAALPSPLFDAAAFARNLTSAFCEMAHKHCNSR